MPAKRQRGETCQNSSRIIHTLIHRHLGMQVQQNITLKSNQSPSLSLSLSLCLSHTHTDLGPAFPSPESWLPASLPTDLLEGDMGAGTR